MKAAPKGPARRTITASRKRAQQAKDRAVYAAVTARDGGCRVCGASRLLERHHIVPRSLGGKTTTDNVLLLYRSCHADVTEQRMRILGNANRHLALRRWVNRR